MTIANDEAKATVTLKAKATGSIPALAATDITTESFTAHWINVDATSAAYTLSVNRASDGAAVDGYPASVSAASQQHQVTGLKPNTAYTYTLSAADGRTSNTVTVTTAAPTPILAFTAPEGGFTLSCAPGRSLASARGGSIRRVDRRGDNTHRQRQLRGQPQQDRLGQKADHQQRRRELLSAHRRHINQG